jgi:phage terminase Nu1 subunit (DNA packaging protein)
MAAKNKAALYTVNALSNATGFDRRTLTKWLATVEPVESNSKGDHYSLRQLVDSAIAARSVGETTLEAERIRETHHKANILELDEKVRRGELVETATVQQTLDNIGFAIRRVITTSHLPDRDKDAILAELRSLSSEFQG